MVHLSINSLRLPPIAVAFAHTLTFTFTQDARVGGAATAWVSFSFSASVSPIDRVAVNLFGFSYSHEFAIAVHLQRLGLVCIHLDTMCLCFKRIMVEVDFVSEARTKIAKKNRFLRRAPTEALFFSRLGDCDVMVASGNGNTS